MMMEPPPSAAFEMAEPNLLFELLIVTLDAPAQFRNVHQTIKSSRLRKGRKPVFCGFFLAFRPLDQEPFFWSALAAFKVSVGHTNAYASKARGQSLSGAFLPLDRTPGALGQSKR